MAIHKIKSTLELHRGPGGDTSDPYKYRRRFKKENFRNLSWTLVSANSYPRCSSTYNNYIKHNRNVRIIGAISSIFCWFVVPTPDTAEAIDGNPSSTTITITKAVADLLLLLFLPLRQVGLAMSSLAGVTRLLQVLVLNVVAISTASLTPPTTVMQNFTNAMCETYAKNGIQLTDSRDNRLYNVRWISGKCWMTDNLALGADVTNPNSKSISINSTNTHINTSKTLTLYDRNFLLPLSSWLASSNSCRKHCCY